MLANGKFNHLTIILSKAISLLINMGRHGKIRRPNLNPKENTQPEFHFFFYSK